MRDVLALLGVGVVALECATLTDSTANNREDFNEEATLGIHGFNDAHGAEVNDLVTDLKCPGDLGVRGSDHEAETNPTASVPQDKSETIFAPPPAAHRRFRRGACFEASNHIRRNRSTSRKGCHL